MLNFAANHAPILTVLLPMLASPIMVIAINRGIAYVLAQLAALGALGLSLHMLLLTMDGSVLSYHLGGWAPPLGIEYRVDTANAMLLVVITLLASVVMPYARKSIEDEIDPKHHTLFYACLMLCVSGLLGVTITGDAFNIFVFLEISSLSTYVLVALGAKKDRRALSASYDYLVLGTIGATFFVIGLGFIYQATGSLNLFDIASRIAEQGPTSRTLRSGFAFIVVGMALKFAMFPLHRWLPGAYAYAPSVVTAFLAATATKVALYVLMRFLFSVYSSTLGFERDTVVYVLLPLSLLAMFVASFMAVFQPNLKRMLAYSSLAQVGYMLLGISLLTTLGLTSTMAHLFNHAITKGALFLAVGAIIFRTGTALAPGMAGLGKKMPWTCAAFVVAGLSLIGVPGTAGFISKFILLQAAFDKGWWFLGLLIVASSLIAVVYIWRVLEVLYLQPVPEEARTIKEAPLSLLLPTWFLALACIWFGLDADFVIDVSRTAAEGLLAGGFEGKGTVIIGPGGRP
ncbi:MAG: monovalent cation/H+ antiporter subunit D family protein [Pseudomonadota bacterium]